MSSPLDDNYVLPDLAEEEYDAYDPDAVSLPDHGSSPRPASPASALVRIRSVISPLPRDVATPAALIAGHGYEKVYEPLTQSEVDIHLRAVGGEAAVLEQHEDDYFVFRIRQLLRKLVHVIPSYNALGRKDRDAHALAMNDIAFSISSRTRDELNNIIAKLDPCEAAAGDTSVIQAYAFLSKAIAAVLSHMK